jgi:uncharacterized membrane protein YedE/YeeE
MHHLLQHRPPFYVLGPALGLVVLGLAATINERFGVMGGVSDVVERATGRAARIGWRSWLLLGVLAGGLLHRLLSGQATVHHGYGWLTRTFGNGSVAVGLVLLAAGGLIGFGAKTAGGCTSGNGLGGCSAGSTASFAATATFMATAIGASFVIRGLT